MIGDYAAIMAPYIGKKAATYEMGLNGGDGYYVRNYYLGRLVNVEWEDGKMPRLEFDRTHRRYGRYYLPSFYNLERLRFKLEDGGFEEDEREMRIDGDGGTIDYSYDTQFCRIYAEYERAKERKVEEIKRREQRYVARLEKVLGKDVQDGIIQLREGQIPVSKKFLGIVSPVFKRKFARTNVISITESEPADVQLFIELLAGKELPSTARAISNVVSLVKLFEAFQAGSILEVFPDLSEFIGKDCARKILDIEPPVADEELLEICRHIPGARRSERLKRSRSSLC